MKKVSIIIPFYKGQSYLSEAVESVRVQSYKNIELIIVNNDISKSTQILLNDIVKQDQRFVLIEESNTGIADALNAGIKKSSGDIIAFLDQDDIYQEDRIKNMVKKMQESGSDFIACRGIKINSKGEKLGETPMYIYSSYSLPIALMQKNLVNTLSYFTIRKNILLKYFPLPQKYSNMLDYHLLMKLINNANKMLFSDELLVKRRYHNSNVSTNMYVNAQQTIPALIDFYRSNTVVNSFYSKPGLKKIITERYLQAVQYLRRRSMYNEIIGFQKEYVDSGYIYEEYYLYFNGIAILKTDKKQFPVFKEQNKSVHPLYHFLLGLYYYGLENYKEASVYFEKAVENSKSYFIEAKNSLALSQFFQNKEKSINTLKKLINLYSKYKDPNFNLNFILKDENHKFKHSDVLPKTLENFMYFDKGLKMNSEHKVAKKILENIEDNAKRYN